MDTADGPNLGVIRQNSKKLAADGLFGPAKPLTLARNAIRSMSGARNDQKRACGFEIQEKMNRKNIIA
ncbi:MAG: hypothetical protein KJP07_08415 [Desulfatitalea sp.]|nr:hypothetical protein [Desulfatitalea sp.]